MSYFNTTFSSINIINKNEYYIKIKYYMIKNTYSNLRLKIKID